MSTHSTINLPASDAADYSEGSVFFIGNATVLIRYAGFTILTDPTFIHMHEQVSVGVGLQATRLTNPAMEVADLPPLDLIVLSHFHGDHFDQVAERDLPKDLPIVTTGHAETELNGRGFNNTYALDTWQSISFVKGDAELRITATPGKHGPGVVDLVLPDVMGSIIEFGQQGADPQVRLYITGDTLLIDDLHEIPKRYPDIDLALLHLGGTVVLGIMVTMDAKQGVEVVKIINAKTHIPIHYNDYDLFKSPLSDFQEQVRAAGLESRVHYLTHGDSFTFHPASSTNS